MERFMSTKDQDVKKKIIFTINKPTEPGAMGKSDVKADNPIRTRNLSNDNASKLLEESRKLEEWLVSTPTLFKEEPPVQNSKVSIDRSPNRSPQRNPKRLSLETKSFKETNGSTSDGQTSARSLNRMATVGKIPKNAHHRLSSITKQPSKIPLVDTTAKKLTGRIGGPFNIDMSKEGDTSSDDEDIFTAEFSIDLPELPSVQRKEERSLQVNLVVAGGNYTGEIKNNSERDGLGRQQTPDKEFYEGRWENNIKQGYGTYQKFEENGANWQVQGHFINDKLDSGYGSLKIITNIKEGFLCEYRGAFKDTFFEGLGELIYTCGDKKFSIIARFEKGKISKIYKDELTEAYEKADISFGENIEKYLFTGALIRNTKASLLVLIKILLGLQENSESESKDANDVKTPVSIKILSTIAKDMSSVELQKSALELGSLFNAYRHLSKKYEYPELKKIASQIHISIKDRYKQGIKKYIEELTSSGESKKDDLDNQNDFNLLQNMKKELNRLLKNPDLSQQRKILNLDITIVESFKKLLWKANAIKLKLTLATEKEQFLKEYNDKLQKLWEDCLKTLDNENKMKTDEAVHDFFLLCHDTCLEMHGVKNDPMNKEIFELFEFLGNVITPWADQKESVNAWNSKYNEYQVQGVALKEICLASILCILGKLKPFLQIKEDKEKSENIDLVLRSIQGYYESFKQNPELLLFDKQKHEYVFKKSLMDCLKIVGYLRKYGAESQREKIISQQFQTIKILNGGSAVGDWIQQFIELNEIREKIPEAYKKVVEQKVAGDNLTLKENTIAQDFINRIDLVFNNIVPQNKLDSEKYNHLLDLIKRIKSLLEAVISKGSFAIEYDLTIQLFNSLVTHKDFFEEILQAVEIILNAKLGQRSRYATDADFINSSIKPLSNILEGNAQIALKKLKLKSMGVYLLPYDRKDEISLDDSLSKILNASFTYQGELSVSPPVEARTAQRKKNLISSLTHFETEFQQTYENCLNKKLIQDQNKDSAEKDILNDFMSDILPLLNVLPRYTKQLTDTTEWLRYAVENSAKVIIGQCKDRKSINGIGAILESLLKPAISMTTNRLEDKYELIPQLLAKVAVIFSLFASNFIVMKDGKAIATVQKSMLKPSRTHILAIMMVLNLDTRDNYVYNRFGNQFDDLGGPWMPLMLSMLFNLMNYNVDVTEYLSSSNNKNEAAAVARIVQLKEELLFIDPMKRMEKLKLTLDESAQSRGLALDKALPPQNLPLYKRFCETLGNSIKNAEICGNYDTNISTALEKIFSNRG